MPGFGISFSFEKGEVQRVDKTLGLTFLGQWLPIMIREGFVGDKNSLTYEGTGIFEVEIGEHKSWVEGEHQGELITQIHSMLELVHVEEDERSLKNLKIRKLRRSWRGSE